MNSHYKTLIIGAGFGGLCMGIKLKERGDEDFVILEKADNVGGTWQENTYPGAGCDVPSALYSYSFNRKYDWSGKWAKQPEILEYVQECVEDYGLAPYLQFGRAVESAIFKDNKWQVSLSTGEVISCQFLVSAIGQLHHAKTPQFDGRDDFKGQAFHSARWDHSIDLSDKRVAVIGNAASAVQLIPEVAKTAKHLTVYHRTPNWVIGKEKLPFWIVERLIKPFVKPFGDFDRAQAWVLGEFGLWRMIKGDKLTAWVGRQWFRKNLKSAIKDKALQEKFTPDYPIGAKRVLLSDDFFPALVRETVDLVFGGVKGFTKTGLTDSEGVVREHDVVVFATGFHTNPFLKDIEVKGTSGETLREKWAEGAYAYHGTMTADYPNLFLLYGPNTNTGHTSIIFKLEQQVGYVLQLMEKAGQGRIDVKSDAETAFNTEMQNRLAKLAWSKVEASWYKDGERVTNNWPGSSHEFKRRLKTPAWKDFEVTS